MVLCIFYTKIPNYGNDLENGICCWLARIFTDMKTPLLLMNT